MLTYIIVVIVLIIALKNIPKLIKDNTAKTIAVIVLAIALIYPSVRLARMLFGGIFTNIEYALYNLDTPFNKDGSPKLVGYYNRVTGEVSYAPKGTTVNPFTGAKMDNYNSQWSEILNLAIESAKRGKDFRINKRIESNQTEIFLSSRNIDIVLYFMGNKKNDSIQVKYIENYSEDKAITIIGKPRNFIKVQSGGDIVEVTNLSKNELEVQCYYPMNASRK